jgi:hypothetical protein
VRPLFVSQTLLQKIFTLETYSENVSKCIVLDNLLASWNGSVEVNVCGDGCWLPLKMYLQQQQEATTKPRIFSCKMVTLLLLVVA